MVSIAIDGPAGAGKSTLSRMLARRLGFLYVDTGALYRAVGLYAVRNGVDPASAEGVGGLLPQIGLKLTHTPQGQRVFLNGEDVSEAIRAPEISRASSAVSAIPAVRSFLLGVQKDFAASGDIVMDGRDIGTVVLPHAQLKIFLTASSEDRARRRFEELRAKGVKASYPEVLADIETRDRQDAGRDIAPLRAAEDAVVVDTTGYEISQSIERLYAIAKERLK